MTVENVEKFLQSQTFKDNVYAELMHRNLISDGYQWKMFCKLNHEREAMVISIYIAKQTKIEVDLEFDTLFGDDYEIRQYIYRKVIKELDKACKKACNQIDAARYFYEIVNNIEEETTMHKTQNEIEFENFANERRAQADASVQAYKDKVENEIEAKRQECQEADRKERAYLAAAQYRYFFDGLLAAGFDENQAMAILLEKCQVTKLEMRG